MSNIDYIIIIAYLLLTLVLGLWSGRNVKNIQDYAVGDRNFTTTTLIMTICATQIGGSTIMGLASEAFTIGLIDMYASVGIIIYYFIIAYVIAPRFKPFLGLISNGEIMEELYGKAARYVTGISSTLVCIGFFAGQVKALSVFFSYFLDLDILTATFASCFIVVAYSSFGGINSVTFTDIIQFITLAVTIPMIYNLSLNVLNGYEELFKRTPIEYFKVADHPSFLEYLMLFFFFCFPETSPSTMQRILMAKDINQVRDSFKATGFVLIPYLFFASMAGIVAHALCPELTPNNAFMFLIDSYMPSGFKGIAIIGMIAIVMSTADSCLNAASVAFTHDVVKPIFGDKLSEKAELNIAKYFTLISGVFAVFIALSFDNLLRLALFVQGFYVPIISMPLLFGLFGFRSSPKTFLAGAFAGALTFLIWKLYDLDNVLGFNSLIPGLGINAIALLLTHYILKEPGGWVKNLGPKIIKVNPN
ncbi:MAG: sodium:solute symporter family protein [Rickettsiaceae bacterium]|jgi:Na+/proline symporter|nr:sodium:solute symporter family protein [Rickettsiaceae bacterium]